LTLNYLKIHWQKMTSLVTSIKKCDTRHLDAGRFVHFAEGNATKNTMMRFPTFKFIVAIQAIRFRDSEGTCNKKIIRL
jgi:hypothetical protein